MKKILLKTWKISRWVLLSAFIILVLLLLAVEIFDRYISSEKGTRWLYNEVPYRDIKIKFTASGVRYLEIGDFDKPALLLVHGAPGSAMDWKAFAQNPDVYKKYRLLIAERPGYGGTRPKGPEKSILVQAQRVLEVLDKETQPAVVMGHSYGGPVAMVMAALAPDKITKVVGVSGQYDPDNEKTFRISYFIDFLVFKYLLPRMIWTSNVEKLSHPAALRDILPYYGQIKIPVILIHGDNDALVPYENSTFLQTHLTTENELVTVKGGDHPLQMTQPDYLREFMMELDF